MQKQGVTEFKQGPRPHVSPPEENVGPVGSAFPQLPWQCRTLSRRCHIDEADSLASCCMSTGGRHWGSRGSLGCRDGKSGNIFSLTFSTSLCCWRNNMGKQVFSFKAYLWLLVNQQRTKGALVSPSRIRRQDMWMLMTPLTISATINNCWFAGPSSTDGLLQQLPENKGSFCPCISFPVLVVHLTLLAFNHTSLMLWHRLKGATLLERYKSPEFTGQVLYFAALFALRWLSQSPLPGVGLACSLPLPLVFVLPPSWPPINKQREIM